MKNNKLILLGFCLLVLSQGMVGCCEVFGVCKKGCMDSNALNYDVSAEKDDGSCKYTSAIFFAEFGTYGGVGITKIDVYIDGNSLGSITSLNPNGVNCTSSAGTVAYSFKSSTTVNWSTNVFLSTGYIVNGSGVISPNHDTACYPVNVTQ